MVCKHAAEVQEHAAVTSSIVLEVPAIYFREPQCCLQYPQIHMAELRAHMQHLDDTMPLFPLQYGI